MTNPLNTTHFVSLIVPVYRQKSLIRNLRLLKKVADNIRYDYEIIVVLDGKVDNSFEKLSKAKIPKVRIIKYKVNHGKSYAIRVGMNKARGDYIMFIDAGLEIDPNGISMLLEHMEWYNADIIVGSKRHPASQVNYNWQRKILSYGYYYIVRLLFGLNIRDTQAGIKIYKKNVIKRVLPRLLEKRFAGDLEILIVASKLGYNRIYEAPIKLDYTFAGLSSAASLKSIYYILLDTLALFYRANLINYYDSVQKK